MEVLCEESLVHVAFCITGDIEAVNDFASRCSLDSVVYYERIVESKESCGVVDRRFEILNRLPYL